MTEPSAFQRLHWTKPSRLGLRPFGPRAAHLFAAMETFGVPRAPQPLEETAGPIEDLSALEELTPREEVIHLLQAAAEIEHTLMLEYLYARFSLPDTAPAEWRRSLMNTAREEMGHLLSVQNLLLALGDKPYLVRLTPENTPDHPFLFRLEPLSIPSAGKYVAAEAPPRNSVPPADLLDFQNALNAAKEAGLPVNDEGEAAHPVGLLYARIYHLLMRTDAPEGPWQAIGDITFPSRHVDDSAFDRPQLELQAVDDTTDPSGWPDVDSVPDETGDGVFVSRVANRADALALVHRIAEQGEGAVTKPNQISHFRRFLTIFHALSNAAGPLPVLKLPADPTLESGPTIDPNRQITDPAARALCALLDARYHLLLAEIALTLRLPGGGEIGRCRNELASHAVGPEMHTGITGTVRAILTRPRTAGADAAAAPCGPTFSEGAPDPNLTAEELVQTIRGHMADSAAKIEAMQRPLAEGGKELHLPLFDNLTANDGDLTAILDAIHLS